MSVPNRAPMSELKPTWHDLLKEFKERLAQRLWAIPAVSEAEKEIVYKEYLSDLDRFEQALSEVHEEYVSQEHLAKDENEVLRSLLGVPEDELRTKVLGLTNDLRHSQKDSEELREQLDTVTARLNESAQENTELRKRTHALEQRADTFRAEQLRVREDDVKSFSDMHEALKNQLKDLETRIANMRTLFSQSNQQLAMDKQKEISVLQKSLLDEMGSALKKKQDLLWAEEEMFAKGVAQRVRTSLVSLQGQLLLTLERLGLLDPESQTEAFWKARWHLLVEGASELSENFRSIQSQLAEVTKTLDDYMHLTQRKEIVRTPVAIKELVQKIMAEVYVERRPSLSVEFLSDDPLPYVSGDSELLEFVLKTLFRNALEALPSGAGKIEIVLKNQSDKKQIQIWVRDSGLGVPPHLVPRLFQPFFTTKEGRQGLNLSRARKYVEYHGGTLDVITTNEQGSSFQVVLPLEGGV